jgi:hypothetical protein
VLGLVVGKLMVSEQLSGLLPLFVVVLAFVVLAFVVLRRR